MAETEKKWSKERVVCVTGAGGYVASWLVKLLLSKDYFVHGTVKNNPGDKKYTHLNNLEKAPENLKIFQADLLDFSSLCAAIAGCTGVFHVASPVPDGPVQDPETDLMEPAVKGTLNVLKACLESNINRVVVVSSTAAICLNPNWPKDQLKDETCWSEEEFCRSIDNWYCLSKTVAESEALKFGKKTGLNVLSVCPTFVFGPLLQSTLNFSSLMLLRFLTEGYENMENKQHSIVDVRDVAEALVLVYEKDEAEGRYICVAYRKTVQDLVEMLKKKYPNYNYPKSFIEGWDIENVTSEKLQSLGWRYRSLEETLEDSVECYKQMGVLD